MILKYFYDSALAQASYLVGCPGIGEAIVIDPARNITPYLRVATEEGLRITHVTETHIHADFVSGTRELGAVTGATMYLSNIGDADWKYQFADANTVLLSNGDMIKFGNVQLEVIATPGHTPEHITFQLTDLTNPQIPVGLFTGDSLFIGSVGRPDLLEKAAGFADTAIKGAYQQFHTMERFKQLPEHLQIWPGHGAGSACGKSLSAMPSSTLGYEKLVNPGLQFDNEKAFTEWLLDSQPEPPRYFAQMKKVNKEGPALLRDLTPACPLHSQHLENILQSNCLVIDTRPSNAFAAGHIPGTLHIPTTSQIFSTYVGWFVDFESPVYLIAEPEVITQRIVPELRAIGVDKIHGFWTPAIVEDAIAAGAIQVTPQIDAIALSQNIDSYFVLDVRNFVEFQESNIPSAHHIMMGYIEENLDDLPRDMSIVVHCQTGVRSQIVASILQKHGFTHVYNLIGGYEAWQTLMPQV